MLADIAANARRRETASPISPIAFEVVRHIDLLFDIECDINGLAAEQRLAVRTERSAPLVADLEAWMLGKRATLSRHVPVRVTARLECISTPHKVTTLG